MDLSAALAELKASCALAAEIPDGLKLLRSAANRLAKTAKALGEIEVARDAESLAAQDGELEQLLALARSLAAGERLSSNEADAGASSEDDALVDMLVQSMNDASATAEELLLQLEADPYNQAHVSELRRVVHTIKGEAGVLGLDAAQVVCHEAEEMVDRCVDAGDIVPLIDPMLGVVDYLRRYAEALRSSGSGVASPPQQALRKQIAATPSAEAEDESGASAVAAHEVQRTLEPAPRQPIAASPSGAGPDPQVSLLADALVDDTLQDFIDESRQHLEGIEADLLEFESKPDDDELLNRIFRAFHTIKGVAGFLNLAPIVRLAHTTETLLDRLRQATIEFQTVHVDLVLTAADLTSKMIESLAGGEAPRVSQLEKIDHRLNQALRCEPVDAAYTLAPAVQETLAALELVGEHAEAPTPARLGDLLVAKGIVSKSRLDEALALQRARAESGESMKLGEVIVELGIAQQRDIDEALMMQRGDHPVARALQSSVDVEEAAALATKSAKRRAQTDATIKVSTIRLDALVDMVGELVIAQQMVLQDPDLRTLKSPVLARNLSQVNKITRDLQEASMSLRMVTFRSTFQKVSRLVRDVAQKAGKKVELEVAGADTEVDRNVVERISDPLVHLIRNAIDHGLEPPAGRREVGKSETGQVDLRAYHSSGAIVVEVKDDGRGLDRDRILAKALEKGLLPPGAYGPDMSDDDVFKLIFEPGFSTAAAVTDISGRGVGMDVVRKNIEAMRGRIEIQSRKGAGTTFLLRLPLTLAIIDGMVVRVGQQRFVIPTLSIEESFQPSARKAHWSADGGPVVDVRGTLVPVRHLSQIVDAQSDTGHEGVMVLMTNGAERFCLQVDEILGQQQVVIKNLGATMPKINGVAGGAIMGDGRVALILDAEGLAREALSAACY
ncbi:MAG: Hpt domain-containing protein [Planctomycetota bacterium]